MDKRIYLCLAHMSGKEMGFIQEAFDTNWVVPLGPNVSGFEQDLEAFVGENKHVVALSAGTAAVHLALVACGVGQGVLRIEPSYDLSGCYSCVCGLRRGYLEYGSAAAGSGNQRPHR